MKHKDMHYNHIVSLTLYGNVYSTDIIMMHLVIIVLRSVYKAALSTHLSTFIIT